MEEATTEIIEAVQVAEPTFMKWFVDLFYYEGDILKTFLALFGLGFIILFFFECMYILKQGGGLAGK